MTDGHGAGHGGVDVGAVSQGNIERDIARTMTARTLAIGKARGGSLVSLTVDKGYPYNINEPVALANRYGVRYAFQHHFNAGGGTGVEVWYYQGDAVGRALAAKVSAAIAKAYGIPDRGAKATTYFGFICDTNMTAFIVEWGFVDAPNNVDCSRIMADPDKGVNAMLTAIGFSGGSQLTTWHVPAGVDSIPMYTASDTKTVAANVMCGTAIIQQATYGSSVIKGKCSPYGEGFFKTADLGKGNPIPYVPWHTIKEDAEICSSSASGDKVLYKVPWGTDFGAFQISPNWVKVSLPKNKREEFDRYTAYIKLSDMKKGTVPVILKSMYPQGDVVVYAQRDTASEVLDTFKAGTKLYLVATFGKWSQVRYTIGKQEKVGFVLASY